MYWRLVLKLALLLFVTKTSFAADIDTRRIKIEYGSVTWNDNPQKIDTAFIYMRDKNSGKIVQINLEETEPDSAIFAGDFSIKYGENGIDPEVFVPPEKARRSKALKERFFNQVQAKKVNGKPLFYQGVDEKNFVLNVFDTQEQAEKAKENFDKIQTQNKIAENVKDIKPDVKEDDVELAKKAEKEKERLKKQQEMIENEKKRLRAEQIAQQKIKEQIEKMKRMKAAEKQARKDKAQRLADEALAKYRAKNYVEAEKLYKEAAYLDPENKSYYFYYGVTLYRNEKLNDAIVTLNISETDTKQNVEKFYFIGLSYSKQKEYALAVDWFEKAKKENHKFLSPTASFYKGLMLMQMENYQGAKAEFEWVIDNSSEPKLDTRAEEMLEKCIRMIAYQEEQKKRLKFVGSVSPQYDSNILLSSDSNLAQGTATNSGGFRIGASAITDFKVKKTDNWGSNINYTFSMTYSLDEDVISADPMLNIVTTPFFINGKMGEKNYSLTFTPGYEILHMDSNDTGVRFASNIQNTPFLSTDWLIINSGDWLSTYSFIYRAEDSLLDVSAEDNADAQNMTLSTTQMFFMDKAKKELLTVNLGYILNNAVGSQSKFNRIDFGVSYIAPITKWKGVSWTTGLSVYDLTYTEHDSNRKDFDVSVTGGLNQALNDSWSWSSSFTYTSNASNVESNHYSKYLLLGSISYNWAE